MTEQSREAESILPVDLTQKAREKIVDLSKDREHLLHGTFMEMLPLILRDGIFSHDYAQRTGLKLPYQSNPVAQASSRRSGGGGFNLISVYDLTTIEGNGKLLTVTDFIFRGSGDLPGVVSIWEGVMLMLSPHLRAVRNTAEKGVVEGEIFLTERVFPDAFNGMIINSSYAHRPLRELDKHVLRGTSTDDFFSTVGRYDRSSFIRQYFLSKPFHQEDLDKLRDNFLAAQEKIWMHYRELAEMFNYNSERGGFVGNHVPFILDHRLGEGNYLHIDNQSGIMTAEADLVEAKKAAAELRKKGNEPTLAKIAEIFQLHTEDISPPIPKSIKKWIFFKGKQARAEISPLGNIDINKAFAICDEVLQLRKARVVLDEVIWKRYVEEIVGKDVKGATNLDFLLGLCKHYGLPLYTTDAEVIWPR